MERRKVATTIETMWMIGQMLEEEPSVRENLDQRYYFDLETGEIEVVPLKSTSPRWAKEEAETRKRVSQAVGTRYIEIPHFDHGHVHKLLDEFVYSLDNEEAKKAVCEKCGVGDTLDILEEYDITKGDFQAYMARW